MTKLRRFVVQVDTAARRGDDPVWVDWFVADSREDANIDYRQALGELPHRDVRLVERIITINVLEAVTR